MKAEFKKTVLFFVLFVSFLPLFSQVLSKNGFIKAVQQADISYYYDQNYEMAAEKYEALYKNYPGNSNLAAKLGICYLNLDGKKPEALKLLSQASKNVVTNDKDYQKYGANYSIGTSYKF